MKQVTLMLTLLAVSTLTSGRAWAWGQEGHSIVAEIAETRLSDAAAQRVASLLKGRSLASVASWADDARDDRPETYYWHFVDIPLSSASFDKVRDCSEHKDGKKGGDCAVNELLRLENELRCAPGGAQVDALKFAVHFVGDIHQPLHTVLEDIGGNTVSVDVVAGGKIGCSPSGCSHIHSNFHKVWDTDLIQKTTWSWGAYVDRLEDGWLKSDEATKAGVDGGTPEDWANETHAAAVKVWNLKASNNVIDDTYYNVALPILDHQLGVAGLRLAKFLNDAYSSDMCPVR